LSDFAAAASVLAFNGDDFYHLRHKQVYGSNPDGENGAWSQLQHPIGCRTKHREVQGATAAHSHSHQVDVRFQGELNDLLVWFSDAHRRLNLERLAVLRVESVYRVASWLSLWPLPSWPDLGLLQHVQQGEFGVVLLCRRDSIVQSPL
jgi:hypothetical protein